MERRGQATDRHGRTWTARIVSQDEAEEEDFRFWYEELTPEERVAPSRIDILSRLASLREFASAWNSRVDAKFGDVDAHYLSLDDLIQEKERADRDQDRADLRSLRRVRSKQS